jgi:hypothetical protein
MRERRRKLLEQLYLGRILAAGFNIPEAVFKLLTTMLSLEITQENYLPKTVDSKKMALETLVEREKAATEENVKVFQKLQQLEVSDDDLRPATPEELEEFKRKMRQRHVKVRKTE